MAALFGTFAHANECDPRLLTRSGLQTTFFDYAQFEKLNEAQLLAMQAKYKQIFPKLSSEYEAMRVDFSLKLQSSNVEQILMAIERRLARLHGKSAAPAVVAHPKIFTVKVGGRDWAEVRAEVAELLRTLSLPTEKQLIRYFASPREDLVVEYGNDRFGLEFEHSQVWDEFGQQQLLRDRGLKADDAIFADEFQFMMEGIVSGSEFEEGFVHGVRSLAVYDMSAMEELELYASDMWIFHDRSHEAKTRALAAIVRIKP